MLRVRQGNWQVKTTLLIPTLMIFLCHDVINITRPNWHVIDLQFSVKDFVPQYTHYVRYVGHKRHHFNVTHIWSKQAMHWITSLHILLRSAWRSQQTFLFLFCFFFLRFPTLVGNLSVFVLSFLIIKVSDVSRKPFCFRFVFSYYSLFFILYSLFFFFIFHITVHS